MVLTGIQLRQLYTLMENGEVELLDLLDELNSLFRTISARTALISSLVVLLCEPRLLSSRFSSLVGIYFLYHLLPTRPPPYVPAFARVYSFYLGSDLLPERAFVLCLLSNMRAILDRYTAKHWFQICRNCTIDLSRLYPPELCLIDKISGVSLEIRAYLLLDRSTLDGILDNIKETKGVQLVELFFLELRRILCRRLCYSDTSKLLDATQSVDAAIPDLDLDAIKALLNRALAVSLKNCESEPLIQCLTNLKEEQLSSIVISPSDVKHLVKFNKDVAKVILCRKLQFETDLRLIKGLESLKISVNALEVLNSLRECVSCDFIFNYISRTIKMINEHPRDFSRKDIQILCIFISYLIKGNVYVNEELLYEIKSLCIQYSSIKEASELFKQISNTETFQALQP